MYAAPHFKFFVQDHVTETLLYPVTASTSSSYYANKKPSCH